MLRSTMLRSTTRPARQAQRALPSRSARVTPRIVPSVSAVDAIVSEHNKVKDLWKEYQNIDNDRKQEIAYNMIRFLAIHSLKEEEVIYPVVRSKMGDEAADQLLNEHRSLKQYLTKLDGLKVGDSEFEPTIKKVAEEFLAHVDGEENEFLPKLASVVDDMEALGKRYQDAEWHVPTRPHILPPDQPPANVVANAATAPIDQARDFIRFGGNPPKNQ